MGQIQAMFETLTLTTLLLVGYFFWQNARLGLTSAIPKDPTNRVHFYCSEALTSLKGLLPQANVQELTADSLLFTPKGSTVAHQLTSQDGSLMLKLGPAPATALAFLGPQGRVEFEKGSTSALLITVYAQNPEASHQVSMRLEVAYA